MVLCKTCWRENFGAEPDEKPSNFFSAKTLHYSNHPLGLSFTVSLRPTTWHVRCPICRKIVDGLISCSHGPKGTMTVICERKL